MTDTKKINDWKIANESYASSQQLRPKEQALEKSFSSASGLNPAPIASVTTTPVNSTTAPTPTASIPTRTR